MRLRTQTLAWLGAIALGGLVAACSDPAPERTLAVPTPSPTAVAPTAVPRGTADVGALESTPIPVADRQTVLEFAGGYLTISSDWDMFHTGFDVWREGLAACDASSVAVALGRFAGDFVALTEAARGLPRDRILREIADRSVSATEREEVALRQLRDNWHPGDTAFFEGVDVARASASSLRKDVEDGLLGLQQRTSLASDTLVNKFSNAFSQINFSWDEFDRSYDSFRTGEPALTGTERLSGLNELVDQFRAIVVAVRRLPTSIVTTHVASLLDRAVDHEDLALRMLSGSFGISGGQAGGAAPDPAAGTPVDEIQNGAQVGNGERATLVQRDPALFDASLISSNALRREASRLLVGVADDASAGSRAAVADFTSQYADLNRAWDTFHQGYDLWRVSEGGCDRAEVVATLGGLFLEFGELADSVRFLPGAVFLQPMGELLVEAVEREERALRGLRSGWRPFDAAVYHSLDRERVEAQRLTRQVATGLRDLLARYDITPPEVERKVERASPSSR